MAEAGTEEKPTVEQPSQVKDSSENKEITPNSLPNSPNSPEASTNLEGKEQAATNVTPGKSGAASIWVNLDKLKLFKAAVKLQGTSTLSEELNALLDKRTAEIKGLVPNSDLTGASAC